MRLLYFIIFFSTILLSEVVTHVVTWDEANTIGYEVPTDESNESENGEENTEDHVEEDKLFNESDFVVFTNSHSFGLLPCTDKTLLHQSLKEIDLLPPDLV